MRSIALKVSDGIDYKSDLAQLISNAGREPYSLPQVRAAMKVLDKIEACEPGDNLLLEETEFAFVRQRIEGAQFIRVDARTLDFVDAVLQAETVEVKAA